MGGLLAVNKGSIDPPTFNILEWKGASPSNDRPIVLVGKGIVYDTGGLSLKPTTKNPLPTKALYLLFCRSFFMAFSKFNHCNLVWPWFHVNRLVVVPLLIFRSLTPPHQM
jgi:hypothetical protein